MRHRHFGSSMNNQFYTWALTGWDRFSNRMFEDFWVGKRHSVCEWVTSYLKKNCKVQFYVRKESLGLFHTSNLIQTNLIRY
jgi:hypothetical protein